jgi:hypothetical protein
MWKAQVPNLHAATARHVLIDFLWSRVRRVIGIWEAARGVNEQLSTLFVGFCL